ncbi:hypothetical protein FACS189497_11260 [Betaproteobacteria bacterium]|nr:hypothetical protein FACS189497_11260 [Betaproteobacteria bacterium]
MRVPQSCLPLASISRSRNAPDCAWWRRKQGEAGFTDTAGGVRELEALGILAAGRAGEILG